MNSPDQTVCRGAVLKALAEYLEQGDMIMDLDRELERNMIYGIGLRASMSAEELERSLEDLVDNVPRLINWERFKDLSEESWGEVAWSEICWNLG
jgi:hypothetical protein